MAAVDSDKHATLLYNRITHYGKKFNSKTVLYADMFEAKDIPCPGAWTIKLYGFVIYEKGSYFIANYCFYYCQSLFVTSSDKCTSLLQ